MLASERRTVNLTSTQRFEQQLAMKAHIRKLQDVKPKVTGVSGTTRSRSQNVGPRAYKFSNPVPPTMTKSEWNNSSTIDYHDEPRMPAKTESPSRTRGVSTERRSTTRNAVPGSRPTSRAATLRTSTSQQRFAAPSVPSVPAEDEFDDMLVDIDRRLDSLKERRVYPQSEVARAAQESGPTPHWLLNKVHFDVKYDLTHTPASIALSDDLDDEIDGWYFSDWDRGLAAHAAVSKLAVRLRGDRPRRKTSDAESSTEEAPVAAPVSLLALKGNNGLTSSAALMEASTVAETDLAASRGSQSSARSDNKGRMDVAVSHASSSASATSRIPTLCTRETAPPLRMSLGQVKSLGGARRDRDVNDRFADDDIANVRTGGLANKWESAAQRAFADMDSEYDD